MKTSCDPIEKVSIGSQVHQFTKSPRFNLCATHAKRANTARAVSSKSRIAVIERVKMLRNCSNDRVGEAAARRRTVG